MTKRLFPTVACIFTCVLCVCGIDFVGAANPFALDDLHLTSTNTALTCYPLANDTDADNDTLSVQSFDGVSTQGGTVSDNGNGTLRYTPASGFAGLDTFGYTVTDGSNSNSATVRVNVNATYNVTTARNNILNGVSSLGDPGGPSGCVAYGPTAYSIGHYGGENRSDPMVAAATLGHGRVLAMPDHQWLRMNSQAGMGDTAKYYLNALEWLAGTPDKTIKIVVTNQDNNDSDVWLTAQGFTNVVKSNNYATELADADVLVGWLGSSISQSNVDIITNFARNGGGLFLADYGIGYIWWWTGTGIKSAPGNRILRYAGIGFAKEGGGSLNIGKSSGQTTSENVIAMLTNSSGYSLTDLDIGGTVMGRMFDILPEGDTLLARLDEKYHDRIDAIIPSPSHGISNSFEKSLLRRECSLLSNVPADEVVAHRSAEVVYGVIPADAPRVTRTISYNVTTGGRDTRGNASVIWLSTGLYVVPGEIVTVSIGSDFTTKGMKVKINGDWNDVSARGTYLRMPFGISREYALNQTSIQTANAYGGLIYIIVPANAAPGAFDVTIENAIEAPYFIFGQDTNDHWVTTLRNKPAPWAELVCDNMIITLSRDKVVNLDKAEELMTFWHDGVAAQDDLAGLTGLRTRPSRMYSMIQTAWGSGYAGYPIGAWNWNFADLASLEQGNCWGQYHETGHLHQSGYWTDDRTGEVTVNVFSMRAIEAVCDSGKASGGWGSQWDSASRVSLYQRALAQGGFSGTGLGERLAMYSQVKTIFGWSAYKNTYQTYHDDLQNASWKLPSGDQQEWDQWMTRLSREVGYDLSPFFIDWQYGVSQTAINSLSDLPKWNMLEIMADSYATAGGIDVLITNPANNDYSFDGTRVLVAINAPEHGEIQDNGNNTWTYTPPVDFTGVDTLTYTVRNGYNNIFTGTISVTVDNSSKIMAYYTMDNEHVSGNTIYDMSGPIVRNAQNKGATTGQVGYLEQGFNFNGSNDYAEIPALNLNSNAVTLTAWIKRNGSQGSYAGIIFSRAGSTTAGLNFLGTTSRLGYHWNNSSNTYNFDPGPGFLVPSYLWTFVALVVEPNKATLYVNDKSAVNNVSHSVEAFDGVTCIGRDSTGRYFKGVMDEVSIWDRALSANDINNLYTSGRAFFNQNPEFAPEPLTGIDGAEGLSYTASIAGSAEDPEESSVDYANISGPPWLSVSANGELSGVPSRDHVGQNNFTIQATDALGGVAQATLIIRVHDIYDGAMGLPDFVQFRSNWLRVDCQDFPACSGCDLDGNQTVNINDLHIFAHHWLE